MEPEEGPQPYVKTVRRTVFVLVHEDLPIAQRAMMWEEASRSGMRWVHRVERATVGAGCDKKEGGILYVMDMELTNKTASRNSFTRFVEQYIPECDWHWITD